MSTTAAEIQGLHQSKISPTFPHHYLAQKIAHVDAVIADTSNLRQEHDLHRALGAAIIAASVLDPARPIHALTSDIRACFPQLNTRWHC